MSPPRIYGALAAVTAELARTGIAKTQTNAAEHYAYRGIDEICNRLAPLLARHKVIILPRVLERTMTERTGSDGLMLSGIALRVAYDFVSARDGSAHTAETWGEALDGGDKASAKAMSAAYKQAVLQVFCIPVVGSEDPDATTHRVRSMGREVADPAQGWEQWASDIQEMIRVCQTTEALDRVQATYRAELRAASKRRPELFAAIGSAMQARRLAAGRAKPRPMDSAAGPGAEPAAVPAAKVPAHA